MNVLCALALVFPPMASASETLSASLNGADILILGEIHDNPVHHINQARIVQEFQPNALVFEMIEPADARKILPETRANAVQLEELLQWGTRGWPDFAMYYPIIAAAPDAAIYGGALPSDIVRRAVGEGAAPVFGDAAALFGLDETLPDQQLADRIQLQQDAHCGALPEEILPGMVEAQRLRDAALSRATVAAWTNANAGDETVLVIVITGNGHAREDWGVPAMLRTYFAGSPDIDIRTLGQFEETAPIDAPFTVTLATKAAERDDPCAVFAK